MTPLLPSSSGTDLLELDPLSIPRLDAISVSDHDVMPHMPPSPGTIQLEPDPALIPSVSTNSESDHGGIPHLPSSPGTMHLEPNSALIPVVEDEDKKNLKCLLCDKYLSNRQHFVAHMASHNSGRILCSISVCHYSARSQGAMDIHMRLKHSDVTSEGKGEVLACWYCGRNMGNKAPLRRHVRNHDSGKFPCSIDNCSSRVMLTQDALDQHLDRKHGDVPDVWVTPRKSSHTLFDFIDGILRVARFGTRGTDLGRLKR